MTPALAVLMALRVKGRAVPAAIAVATLLSEPVAREALAALGERGVLHRTGDGDIVALTSQGRAELATLLAGEALDRSSLAVLHDRFASLDHRLKEAITAWQLAQASSLDRPGTLASPARPTSAEAETSLRAAAAEAVVFARDLGAVAARFAPYASRLRAALAAIEHEDARFVASPFVDSLHQVWFELHEDLLITLGRTRPT